MKLTRPQANSNRDEEEEEEEEQPLPQDLPAVPTDPSTPIVVPLTAIPAFMLDERPEVTLSPYDMSRAQYPDNVLALVHNAARLEMADMWGDILPSLQSRCDASDEVTLSDSDARDMRDWWAGFARFALTVSLVDEFVCKKAFNDVYVGFDKDSKNIEKSYMKLLEKNTVYLEVAVRNMAKTVDEFEDDTTADGFAQLVTAWETLASRMADIYTETEALVASINRWMRDPIAYKDLEKHAVKIFTSKKRWGDDETKRGEMIVILCRWFGTEDLMREWMFRNLTKKELKSIDKWMDDYRAKRLAIIDRFHHKKV